MSKAMIRVAVPGDAVALIECIRAAYAQAAARGVDLPPVADGIVDDISTHLVWVAELHGKVVAGLIAGHVGQALHIMNLAVHPDGQGRGIAKALLDLAETVAAVQGVKELRLATHQDMPENVALYCHLGWEVEDVDGIKVLMTKPVRA